MTLRHTAASSLLVAMIGCADNPPGGVSGSGRGGYGGSDPSSGAAGVAGSGGGAGFGGTPTDGATTTTSGTSTTTSGGGSAGTGSSAGVGGSAGSGGNSDDGGGAGSSIDSGTPPPADAGPSDIPTPTGSCPAFVQGDVTFNPVGGARKVAITMTDASRTIGGGPLIFYWFATGSNPTEAQRGLPLAQVTAAGGIVVAPYDVAGAGTYPWLSQLAQHDALFDEVLGCAVRMTHISATRIHAVGFSAGALMTTHLSFARSKYLASVATYSGGAMGTFQESNNKFAAMIMTGGPTDIVVNNFFTSSQQWQQTLKDAGHFAMFCNHGGGHSIPSRLVPGVWQFFVDHPYGRAPSPYQGHIPATIAPPCVE